MTNTNLERALYWAGRGMHVFPFAIVTTSEGKKIKKPLITEWQHAASLDEKQIRDWWSTWDGANIGCVPARSGHVVFDLDVKNGKNGVEALEALEAANSELPETLVIKTPSGGLHFWFNGSAPNSAGRIAPGIDVRGESNGKYGFVGMPDGKAYEIVADNGDFLSIPDAPEWLLKLASLPKHEAQAAPANIVEDDPGNVARAKTHAKNFPLAEEGTRNDMAYKLFCDVRDLGAGKETALELVTEWNARNPNPLDLSEIEGRAWSVYDQGNAQNAAGCYAVRDPAKALKDYEGPSDANNPAADEVADGPISFQTVLARSVLPVQELVHGLIEKGTVTFLSGPGGTHKSRVALQWGLSVDSATPIYGRSVERSTFVYLSYEDHCDEVARRAQAIARRLSLPRDGGRGQFWDLSGKDATLAVVHESSSIEMQPHWHKVRDHLRSIDGHKFVVIDSTYNALRFVGAAKINEASVMAAIGLMQRLCDETNSTIIMLWHPSQAGQERGDASGWSVAWHNAPRARLSLAAVKDTDDAFELKVEKRNHGPKGQSITLYFDNGALLPRTQTDGAKQAERFLDACVQVAIKAAEQGTPIQHQRRLHTWMKDEIERLTARRPSERDVKEALATAASRALLRYIKGAQHRTAGYYPPELEQAKELANAAKRQAGKGVADA